MSFNINDVNSTKAFLNPWSITKFLSNFISKGFEISIFSILKDFASTFIVEKKNKNRDRIINKIYNFFKRIKLFIIFILYSNE